MDNINNSEIDKKTCEAKVIDSKTLPECSNESFEPIGKNGPLVAKIPVVIAEPKIQIDVKAEIKLEEPALEIKRIKKNLFLTQCKLVSIWDDKHEKSKQGKLFIGGFVRKNIEYATVDCKCAEKGCISGDIRHTTCNIPFECVTMVDFINPPEIRKSGATSEVEIFTTKFNVCDPCSEAIIGSDPCQQTFNHFEAFTEKVFCELEFAKIIEADIHKNPKPLGYKNPNEHIFDTLVEKMIIYVKLKLLQNQQIKIPSDKE